uniref:RNase_Zc3h12a domain-containing protein n=1 Tax=Steinernema glaseri TaxID=37863 RepID=A0A1I7ZDK4_9BILA
MDQLRPIYIDGADVGKIHGQSLFFSCAGIRDCVNFFKDRGHKQVYVFVPSNRRETPRSDSPMVDQVIALHSGF